MTFLTKRTKSMINKERCETHVWKNRVLALGELTRISWDILIVRIVKLPSKIRSSTKLQGIVARKALNMV